MQVQYTITTHLLERVYFCALCQTKGFLEQKQFLAATFLDQKFDFLWNELTWDLPEKTKRMVVNSF